MKSYTLSDLELHFNPRIITVTDTRFSREEMQKLGCREEGIRIMLPKSNSITLKLEKVLSRDASILKQAMLSIGGDVAVHQDVITGKVNSSDVLLIGTLKHFNILCQRLKLHHWQFPEISKLIKDTIRNYFTKIFKIPYPGGFFTLGKSTKIMGILNVTPDSFYDGGKFLSKNQAIEHALKMAEDGADIIDIGGESTRPGSNSVPLKEEINRVIPVIEILARKYKLLISIDTRKAKVAKEAIEAGAKMVNDITGLWGDKKMTDVVAQYKVPIILMHIQGKPKTMQKNPHYKDLMSEIILYLRKSIQKALKAGLGRNQIIVDPGIGFGKLPEHNLEILKRLNELHSLGCPIAIGTSRKSFIGHYLNRTIEERLFGTFATVAVSIINGANIIRVHDVKEIVDVARITDLVKPH